MKIKELCILLLFVMFFQSVNSQGALYGIEFGGEYGNSKYDKNINLSLYEYSISRDEAIERFEIRKDNLQKANDTLKIMIPLGILICIAFSFWIYNSYKTEIEKQKKISFKSEFYMLIILFLLSCSITLLFYGYYVMAFDPLHLYNGKTDINKWITAERYALFYHDIKESTTNCFIISAVGLVMLRCLRIIASKVSK